MCLCHQAAELANSITSTTIPATIVTEIGLRSPHLSRDLLSVNPHLCAHFDLAMSRKLRRSLTDAPWLVLHLGDLVRVTFVAATANSDHLRRFGLFALKQVIQFFAPVVDPDSAGWLKRFFLAVSFLVFLTRFLGLYHQISGCELLSGVYVNSPISAFK